MTNSQETTDTKAFFSDEAVTPNANNNKAQTMKGTRQFVDELTAQGFRLTRTYLAWIIRDRHIAEPARGPGGCFLWSEADEDRLRSFLLRQGRGPQQ